MFNQLQLIRNQSKLSDALTLPQIALKKNEKENHEFKRQFYFCQLKQLLPN